MRVSVCACSRERVKHLKLNPKSRTLNPHHHPVSRGGAAYFANAPCMSFIKGLPIVRTRARTRAHTHTHGQRTNAHEHSACGNNVCNTERPKLNPQRQT